MFTPPPRFLFFWRATSPEGQPIEGYIEASSKNVASILLLRRGITPHQLKRSTRYPKKTNKKRLTVSFFKQLAVLLKANLPLIHALETLKMTQHHHGLKQLIEQIQQHLQKGLSFSNALEQYPRYFTPLMCQLIAIGEQASQFDATIFKLAYHEETQLQTQRQFYLALTYPALIVIISLSLIIGLCTFVLPQFLSFYHTFQVELPQITRAFITLTHWIKSYGMLSTTLALLVLFASSAFYRRHLLFKQYLDHRLLQIPYVGRYVSTLIMTRLASTLSLTLQAGLPLIDALKLLTSIAGNTEYEKALLKIYNAVREGTSLTQAMRLTQRFSPDFIEMVAIGEESGKLASMFSEIATHFEETIKRQTLLWNKLLEPLTMVILGAVMGLFLLALYLPIFQLGVAL